MYQKWTVKFYFPWSCHELESYKIYRNRFNNNPSREVTIVPLFLLPPRIFRATIRTSRRGLGIFLVTTMSRRALEPNQSPIRWVRGALSLRAKRPVREADHSPPSSAEIKELVELYFHSPNTPSWRGAWLSTGTNLHLPLTCFLSTAPTFLSSFLRSFFPSCLSLSNSSLHSRRN
jgi:hypothetical protein